MISGQPRRRLHTVQPCGCADAGSAPARAHQRADRLLQGLQLCLCASKQRSSQQADWRACRSATTYSIQPPPSLSHTGSSGPATRRTPRTSAWCTMACGARPPRRSAVAGCSWPDAPHGPGTSCRTTCCAGGPRRTCRRPTHSTGAAVPVPRCRCGAGCAAGTCLHPALCAGLLTAAAAQGPPGTGREGLPLSPGPLPQVHPRERG